MISIRSDNSSLTEYYTRQNGNLGAGDAAYSRPAEAADEGQADQDPAVLRSLSSLRWIASLPATTLPCASMASLPSASLTNPPASRRTTIPAARSQAPQVSLPEAVEPACRGPGEVERGGAEPPHAGRRRHHGAKLGKVEIVRGPAAMGDAGADHGVGKIGPRGDPDAAIVEKGALALLGGENLVGRPGLRISPATSSPSRSSAIEMAK